MHSLGPRHPPEHLKFWLPLAEATDRLARRGRWMGTEEGRCWESGDAVPRETEREALMQTFLAFVFGYNKFVLSFFGAGSIVYGHAKITHVLKEDYCANPTVKGHHESCSCNKSSHQVSRCLILIVSLRSFLTLSCFSTRLTQNIAKPRCLPFGFVPSATTAPSASRCTVGRTWCPSRR